MQLELEKLRRDKILATTAKSESLNRATITEQDGIIIIENPEKLGEILRKFGIAGYYEALAKRTHESGVRIEATDIQILSGEVANK